MFLCERDRNLRDGYGTTPPCRGTHGFGSVPFVKNRILIKDIISVSAFLTVAY